MEEDKTEDTQENGVLADGALGDQHTVEPTAEGEDVPPGEDEPVDVSGELPKPDEETDKVSPGYIAPETATEPVPAAEDPAPPADAADGANSQSA